MHSGHREAAVQPGLSALLHEAATTAQRIASTERAVAALPGHRRHAVLVAAQADERRRVPTRTLRAVVQAVHCNGPIVVPDIGDRYSIPSLQPRPRGISSLAAVPLHHDARGGCLLVTSSAPRNFTRVEMEALALVAAQTTEAIGHLHDATTVRHQFARELHDTVTQTLTLLAFSLDELLDATRDHAAHALASIARAQASTALHQVRDLLGEAGSGERVLARLERLVPELTRAGVEVHLSGTLSDDTIPQPVADGLLHIAHEALMNIRRHAGARLATVVFKRDRGSAWLVVTDDGRGLNAQKHSHLALGGNGLPIMHDRAQRLGGQVAVRNRPSGGTVVTARIPLPR
jgi:signal transduction histidine kinase